MVRSVYIYWGKLAEGGGITIWEPAWAVYPGGEQMHCASYILLLVSLLLFLLLVSSN